ncbi:TRAP transporter large permease [Sphaerochaeta sp.]|jgi:tripartite ATP-independent transporter DctM subunit|uniref:Sialic acid TRAP transporter permease protein SiaT n=1 Tax=bioreactor metagenome TaxID=1076179 RepID=A0A644VW52_9ZZZZ|nr:TRAP transporter large permease [Sphaerochaeta sp.]MDT3360212.1 TRAP transporter large permease [Spirochaetota bacterium]MDD2395164.1 TRAP transporter large permease [Sphaerochaeta sp.]MDD3423792.1 TRAP transporter large permease [Sphaerochaeta sp.]MDD3456708.1 TRAP transporter large permease [Sphaerochaeta sp.]MDD4038895.1 TRAP transporter large permease [Sphaerochaeta sp.]
MSFLWMVIFIFVAIFLEVPVAFSFIAGTVAYLIMGQTFPITVVAGRLGPGLDSFPLLALPLFVFAGNLLGGSGIAKRIFSFANSSVGHIPGGLGHVNVLSSIVFAGMSGVAMADAAGLGKIEMEEMERHGYPIPFSAAITAASATIGPIIPPSGQMVIIAVLANIALDKLFLAGFIPGLMLGGFLMITIYIMVKSGYVKVAVLPKEPISVRFSNFLKAAPALAIPVFLIVGLITGVATPTELGALTCLFAIILGFIYKDLTLRSFLDCALESAKTTGVLGVLLLVASPFTWLMGVGNVGLQLQAFMLDVTTNPIVFLLIANVVLLIAGMFMETTVVVLIAAPILFPIAASYGIDSIHFAMVMLINLLMGTLTPPFGSLLFVMMNQTKLTLAQMFKAVAPFYFPYLAFLVLITMVPSITTFVPRLFGA